MMRKLTGGAYIIIKDYVRLELFLYDYSSSEGALLKGSSNWSSSVRLVGKKSWIRINEKYQKYFIIEWLAKKYSINLSLYTNIILPLSTTNSSEFFNLHSYFEMTIVKFYWMNAFYCNFQVWRLKVLLFLETE